jgi:uncharacterized protein (UPF0262 family)
VLSLNNSKLFAGVIMILLNVGSKFIPIQFSKSTEEYLKMNVTKQLLVFAMAWMSTRDIYTAVLLTALFTVLSDYLLNEESYLCCVPRRYRVLPAREAAADQDQDGVVSEEEIGQAIAVLEKARRDRQKLAQRKTFMLYGNYLT